MLRDCNMEKVQGASRESEESSVCVGLELKISKLNDQV